MCSEATSCCCGTLAYSVNVVFSSIYLTAVVACDYSDSSSDFGDDVVVILSSIGLSRWPSLSDSVVSVRPVV